jgi:hypothetical protein
MITTQLKAILTSAGCEHVLYESDKMSNVIMDIPLKDKIIGLIIQSNEVLFEVKANAVTPRYPITVEILQQVTLEDTAENNEAKLTALFLIARTVLNELIISGLFHKILNTSIVKVTETRYDANVIGWAMTLDLKTVEGFDFCLTDFDPVPDTICLTDDNGSIIT